MPADDPAVLPKARRSRRILLWTAIVLVALFGLLALIAQLTVAPEIKSQLVAAVEDHLHATLKIGGIRYRIPFTVHLYDVQLIAHPEINGGQELLSARRINLSLANIPLGGGPVIIERLSIVDPAVRVVRQANGEFAGLDLLKPTEPAHPHGPIKLSDVLRLRRFSLRDGTISVVDETPGAALGPTEWKNIDSDMSLAQNSPSLYSFHFTVANGGAAAATVNGSFDVDSLQLKVNRLAASVRADQPSGPSDALPPELRHLLEKYSVGGSIAFNGTGDVPLQSPEKATFTSDLSLSGANAKTEDGLRLDDLHVEVKADRAGGTATTRPVTLTLAQFDASAGGAKFHIQPTTGRYDPNSGHWSVNGITGSFDSPVGGSKPPPWDLTGHADFHADLVTKPNDGLAALLGSLTLANIAVRPPGSEAVSGLTGDAQLGMVDGADGTPQGAIDLHDVSVFYGKDHWLLKHAQIPLAPLPGRIQVDRIDAAMQFASPATHYPDDMGDVMDQLRPAGPFSMTGVAAGQWVLYPFPHYSPIWELNIQTDNDKTVGSASGVTPSLTLLDGRLPVTQMVGELLLTKHAFDLRHLTGKALGGLLTLSVNARIADPITYQGHLDIDHASIEQAAMLASDGKSTANLPTGVGHVTVDFFSRPPKTSTQQSGQQAGQEAGKDSGDSQNATMQQLIDVLGGDGKVHVVNGNLYSVAAVKNLGDRMKLAKEAFTAGEGGGAFSIINRAVYIRQGAVNMPAVGIDGSGTVTFTRQLDLNIIAAPLGDWRNDLQKTNVPILSGALAAIAGGLESAVNRAQELLYQFHITGSADNPTVTAVPAPLLTDSAARVFAAMMHPNGKTQLMDVVTEQATTAPTTAP